MKQKFKDYQFFLNLDNKFRIDNMNLNELDKLSLHERQNVKILALVKEVEDKKTKTGNYFYQILLSLPGKRKYLKAIMFSTSIITIKPNSYYIIDGKIEQGDPKFIKANEKRLGKKAEYKLNIKSLEEYKFKNESDKTHYDISRAELHCHTKYSKRDAFNDVSDYKKAFEENKLHAVAITDHANVSAFVEFVKNLKDFKDTKKLILGCEFYSIDDEEVYRNNSKKITEYIERKNELEKDNSLEESESKNIELKEKRKERDKIKNFLKRKTISQSDIEEGEDKLRTVLREIYELENSLKDLKTIDSQNIIEIETIKKEIAYLEEQLGKINDVERDHITVLLKSKDEEIMYRGEPLTINKGLVALYKLITKSYAIYPSVPTKPEFKKQGQRNMMIYSELFNPEIRNYFIITSACAFGRHMKLAVENRWDEFRDWIKKLDAVEIQPSWNNSYMVMSEDYPNINDIEDVYALHRKIYEICKEENIPCIITSDAHVNNKEDRIFRANFKNGYISQIVNSRNTEKPVDESDFAEEKQPHIMSYYDVIEDYTKQGFSKEEIEEMHNNTNKLADECANGLDITILPNKLFIPDFPDVDAKKEVIDIATKFIKNKYEKDGKIDKVIEERFNSEIDSIIKTGFAVLYYIAYVMCLESVKLGYPVGSRGSAGSMLLTYALNVGENNPLPPHYYCEKCHHVEWVDTELVGLDLPSKKCPECETLMYGDGLNIEAQNFVG